MNRGTAETVISPEAPKSCARPCKLRSQADRQNPPAIAVAGSCIRAGARGRFFTIQPARGRGARQGRIADYLTRIDFVILDELDSAVRPVRRAASLPPRQPAVLAHLDPRRHLSRIRRVAERVRRPQDDHRAPRPAHPSLRHHRDLKRKLVVKNRA